MASPFTRVVSANGFTTDDTDLTASPADYNSIPNHVAKWTASGGVCKHYETTIAHYLVAIDGPDVGKLGIYGRFESSIRADSILSDGNIAISMRHNNVEPSSTNDGRVSLVYYNAYSQWRLLEYVTGTGWVLRGSWSSDSPVGNFVPVIMEILTSNQVTVTINGTDRIVASLSQVPDKTIAPYTSLNHYHSNAEWDYYDIYGAPLSGITDVGITDCGITDVGPA